MWLRTGIGTPGPPESMPISRYPRFGQRLAPSTLEDVLAVPVPERPPSSPEGRALLLSDLDESAWERFGPEACIALAESISRRIVRSAHLLHLGGPLAHLVPPRAPAGVTLDDLEIGRRTYNCLMRPELPFRENASELAQWPVGELLEIPGFGTTCLVDLLTSLESHASRRRATPAVRDLGSLEEELAHHLGSWQDPRRARLAASALGWDGLGGRTLADVGRKEGVTRERIRQICERTLEDIEGRSIRPPRLHRALELVGGMAPAWEEDLAEALAARGISRRPFRLRGLSRAAEVFYPPVPFDLVPVGGRTLVFQADPPGLGREVIRGIRRRVRGLGFGLVGALASEFARYRVSTGLLREILALQPHVWVAPDGSFFLNRAIEGAITTRIRKVLSISGRIGTEELRKAVGRSRRRQVTLPPMEILLRICRKIPELKVEGTVVRAVRPLDWKKQIRGMERRVVEVLMAHPGGLPGTRLRDLCLDSGVSLPSYYGVIAGSPVLARPAPGFYALAGRHKAARRRAPVRAGTAGAAPSPA